LAVAVPTDETYNQVMMTKAIETPKQGDECPACGEATLTVSPSGQHLICPKCGRVVVLGPPPPVQSGPSFLPSPVSNK
jgi:rubrerythrin